MTEDAIERLERWCGAERSRRVDINIPDGFGAGCGMVSLYGSGRRVACQSEYDPVSDEFMGLSWAIHRAVDIAEGQTADD